MKRTTDGCSTRGDHVVISGLNIATQVVLANLSGQMNCGETETRCGRAIVCVCDGGTLEAP